MKKPFFMFLFFFLSFFISCLSFLAPPSLAFIPVIIDDTRHYYPNTSGDDQNYIPSDPESIETIPIEKIYTISESFSPILESPPGVEPPIYKYQDINKIQQGIESRELNTGFYRQNYFHFSQSLIDPLATPETIKSSFTSYNSNHNASRRLLPAATQRCYISQQISDISTFIDSGNSICIDREIDTSKGKIRVGEVVLALINNGLGTLYYSDPKCSPDQKPEDFPSNVISALKSVKYKFSLSLAEYQQLYLYGIEPVCTNSLAQSVVHCDLSAGGQKSSCQTEIRSQPLAAATANENIYRNLLPESEKNTSRDYSQVQKTSAEIDKPNPLSWTAQYFEDFYSGRLDHDVTFSGPHSITTKVDARQITGLEAHETAIKNFIPTSSTNFDDLPSSGTNNITLDPGESNSKLENIFFSLTRPVSWK